MVRQEGARGYRDGANPGRLEIRYRWHPGAAPFLHLVLGLAAAAIMLSIIWRSGAGLGLAPGRVLGLSIVSAMGLAPIYLLLARCLNHAAVTVGGETLRVRHGPLPWLRPDDVPLRDVERIECARKSRSHAPCRVVIVFRSGFRLPILDDFPDAPSAQAVEDLLAAHLGLAQE